MPEGGAPTVIQTLGFYESKRLSPLDHLYDHLRDKVMLLVLDNLEQVIAAAPAGSRCVCALSGNTTFCH